MLIKFLDDYEEIILLCDKKNYSRQKTEEALVALEIHRFITQKQLPRTKELNQVINAVYKTKFNENHDPENGQFSSGGGGGNNSNKIPNDNNKPAENSSNKPSINPKNGLPFDGNKALNHLDKTLLPKSEGQCGKHVADAIRAGNTPLEKLSDKQAAKDYGPNLEKDGFQKISENNPPVGDIKPKMLE